MKLTPEQLDFKNTILIPLLKEYEAEDVYNSQSEVIQRFKKLFKQENRSKQEILKYFRNIRNRYNKVTVDSSTKIENGIVVKEKRVKKCTTKDNVVLNIQEDTQENIRIDKITTIRFDSPLSQLTIKIAEKTLQKCNEYIDNFNQSNVVKAKADLMTFYNTYLEPLMVEIRNGKRMTIPLEQMKAYNWMENNVVNALKHIERAEKSELYVLSTIQETIFNTEKAVNGSILNNKVMIEQGNICLEPKTINPNEEEDNNALIKSLQGVL